VSLILTPPLNEYFILCDTHHGSIHLKLILAQRFSEYISGIFICHNASNQFHLIRLSLLQSEWISICFNPAWYMRFLASFIVLWLSPLMSARPCFSFMSSRVCFNQITPQITLPHALYLMYVEDKNNSGLYSQCFKCECISCGGFSINWTTNLIK
jgi:hypothetical protein